MKKIILNIFAICLFTVPAFAQLDRSKAPEPGPAPEIRLGDYDTFTLENGLQVFVVRNDKLPRVAYSLLVDRDPVLEGEKAGYVSVTGELLRHGTTNRTKDQLDEEIDFLGANLSTSSTGVYASSLSKYKEKLMELLADVVLNPAFPEEELEKLITQTKSGLAASKDNPQAIAANVQSVLLYGKEHPYGEIVTEETVENITLEDAKKYYQTYFKPNIAYLAIVGDITTKEAKKLTKKYLGEWERGEVPSHEYADPEPLEATEVALVDRPTSVQSVVHIMHPVNLEPGDEDVIPARLMNDILGGGDARLFNNLREDKGYTYGAYSSLLSDELVGKFVAHANVRNAVTDSAVMEFMKELKNMRQGQVSDEELESVKNYLTGSFARSLESPQTIASFALNIARYGLDKDYYKNYLKNVEAVTKEDVQRVAQKYIQPEKSYIMVVGNADDVKDGLSKFGEVEMYDIYGNKVEEKALGNVFVEQVIDRYIEAIGGREKLEQIENVKQVINFDINGMEITNTTLKKGGNKYLNSTKVGEQEISKMVYANGEGKMMANGQIMDVPSKQLAAMKSQAFPFPELHLQEAGIEAELKGITKINGKDAYQVVMGVPEGEKSISYFDKETGLMLKTETPMVTIEVLSYQEVDGIKVPKEIRMATPQGTFEGEVVSMEFNTDIPDATFSLN